MTRRGFGAACAVAMVLAPMALVRAAVLPDGGQLLQQMEKEIAPQLPPRQAPEPPPPPAPMTELRGPTLTVKAFRFVGNTHIDTPALAAAVSGFVNRPLNFDGLQAAAAAVAEVYRKAGWVVRAYLPEQDIVDGVVVIHIIEAVFGGTRLEGPPPGRIDADRVRATIERALPVGAPVNTDKLDRGLLLLGDLPGLSAQGMLRPGRNERETELAVRTEDGPLVSGVAGADNFGGWSTGMPRGSVSLFVNSPLGLGDQAVVSAIGSQGNQYGRLAWSVPVGYDGWRVGASASYLRYRIVSSDFADLDARGTSATLGLNAAWPIIRMRTANLYLGLNYDHRGFDNKALSATVSNYNVDSVSAGLSGNLFDEWGGRGTNVAAVTLTHGIVGTGHPDFGDVPSDARSRYTKLTYSLSREQHLIEDLSAYVALSGQISSRNLDSSEKFYVGGPNAVRALSVDATGAARGEMINVELRWRLPFNITAAAFFDWAHLGMNHSGSSWSATTPNSFTVEGGGLSVAWQADFGLNLRATWAHRIGANHDPAANGGSQGNLSRRDRFWLSATQPF